ncbi:protein of unknown function [Candidatus Hydrogenisulfobacillus filiaventi]|uniref:Uncharacterized protein n=1 Tax=Candidatus Hydrogenisulfobacillus filiaventi TaxID=2707344 RepID=A0A6F8ZF43_9FIRM|nr:protein of unknown function [Candidatus Hydrogenisulfobacillus filiaventi]
MFPGRRPARATGKRKSRLRQPGGAANLFRLNVQGDEAGGISLRWHYPGQVQRSVTV